MKKIILILTLLFCSISMHTLSARLVIDGAYLKMEGDIQVFIDNSNANGISRTAKGGHFISESENNNVIWNIKNTNASYTIPFGYGITNYLPLTFKTFSAVGNGRIETATYGRENWKNTDYMPAGIVHMGGLGGTGADNSAYVMDRFWKLKFIDYSTKPSLEVLSLSYRDIEHQAPNTILEGMTIIQRYNPNKQDWYDYIPTGGSYSNNTTNNTVQYSGSIPANEIYDWWVIVDELKTLAVEFIDFDATWAGGSNVLLEWSTASEENSDYFIVERSLDGIRWESVAQVTAAGSSQSILSYDTWDEYAPSGNVYYRIKQVDYDGSYIYSKIRQVEIPESLITQTSTLLYPNPTSQIAYLKFDGNVELVNRIELYDALARQVNSHEITPQAITTIDVSRYAQGVYFIKIYWTDKSVETLRLIKQ